jgi:hypothetical protein
MLLQSEIISRKQGFGVNSTYLPCWVLCILLSQLLSLSEVGYGVNKHSKRLVGTVLDVTTTPVSVSSGRTSTLITDMEAGNLMEKIV